MIKTYKVVYNACHGGCRLSVDAEVLYQALAKKPLISYGKDKTPRHCRHLVKVVETLGEGVNSEFSKLTILKIPVGEKYFISEYDGLETVYTTNMPDVWIDPFK